jgi:putative hydrolase
LQGVEANILADGEIDLPLAARRKVELVVAAPHSRLRSDEPQTERMLAAVRAGAVHILGHPRGRKYGVRPGVSADWESVFAAAAEARIAVELDGDPQRQDLDFALARRALAAGCLFAVDSDAHATEELRFAETALAHAHLAGIPADRIINFWPLPRLLTWLEERRSATPRRRA